MGRHKKIIDIEITPDEEKLPLKTSTSQFSGKYLKHFSEETYNKSLREAFSWADGINENGKEIYSVELIDYFKQKKGNKCIFVSYNTKPKVNSEDTN